MIKLLTESRACPTFRS